MLYLKVNMASENNYQPQQPYDFVTEIYNAIDAAKSSLGVFVDVVSHSGLLRKLQNYEVRGPAY